LQLEIQSLTTYVPSSSECRISTFSTTHVRVFMTQGHGIKWGNHNRLSTRHMQYRLGLLPSNTCKNLPVSQLTMHLTTQMTTITRKIDDKIKKDDNRGEHKQLRVAHCSVLHPLCTCTWSVATGEQWSVCKCCGVE